MEFDDFWHDLRRLRAARRGRRANLIAWRSAPSSHRTARRLVQEYGSEDSPPPRVDIVAFEQSAGHGREGRAWSSPPAAGVYASLVRSIAPEMLPKLPMLVPVALAEALGEMSDRRCRIKWPNDLVADGAKLGGILIDVSVQGDRHSAIISFGVNVAAELELFDQARVTSLGALGVSDLSPASIFDRLLRALESALESAPADLVDRYRSLSSHGDGERVRWRQGERDVQGIFRGFDDHGRLRLEIGGELELVTAGALLDSGSAEPAAARRDGDDTARDDTA